MELEHDEVKVKVKTLLYLEKKCTGPKQTCWKVGGLTSNSQLTLKGILLGRMSHDSIEGYF